MARTLLFLVADTGGGHRAAATATARWLDGERPGEFDIAVVDPAAAVSPPLGRLARLYGPLIQHGRWAWGALYHATNSRAATRALLATALRPLATGIEGLIERLHPAAVVSFHPLLNHVAAQAAARGGDHIPVITVITDLVDVHSSWLCAEVDAVVAASPGGLDRCRRAGIPADRVHLMGLPVDPAFTRPPLDADGQRRLRRSLGLDGDRFAILVCSGADGSGGIARRARALAGAGLEAEVVVICGHNRRAVAELARVAHGDGRPLHVRGFVDNMADWMRAADVVVTKAGPGTITEALCCGVPLLLTWYLPGQERANVEWVVDTGAGRYVPRLGQLVDAVAELSVPGSPTLATMRDVVRKVARPDATARIGELVAAMAARPR
ncbi:MAG: MGDG synthase family glycosyltransferase [Candidatus Dormibacteria bacterium]